MDADAPRFSGLGRREIRVRHDDPRAVATSEPLHARILVAMDSVVAALGEHLLELVRPAVARREHEHVGDVIEEAGPVAVVSSITAAHAAREQVEAAVVVDHAGVEDRTVARHRAGRDDRCVADPPHGEAGVRHRAVRIRRRGQSTYR
jgi:hypothetical protein